ncbi:MAG: acetyl-CoA C-acyltransferase [Ilumatobacteraceae bacterium]
MPSVAPVVVVDAVRSAVGRRNGALAHTHPNEVLGTVLAALVDRTGIDPSSVDQVIGGCVGQVGAQSSNVIRQAWLTAGLPLEVPATTANVQCGSAQQSTTLAHGLVASGLVDVAIACGIEAMSTVVMGSSVPRDPDVGEPRTGRYAELYEPTTQFEGADRIAAAWELSRDELDEFGLRSQELAAKAWAEDRFAGQIVAIEAVTLDDSGAPNGTTPLTRDEGLRTTSREALSGLRTNRPGEDGGLHTAGTSSQISDGAAALMLMTEDTAERLGFEPRARIVDSVLVGSDPVLMLTGPMPATRALLERTGLTLDDIDLFEINEAFASVVLAWQKEVGADPDRVNPNGGAIALGHPLGATGCILLTKALYELERSDADRAIVSMCCGGGLGTGTLLQRM